MAIKIYTEKLHGYATAQLRNSAFLTWVHNCFIDSGFEVLRSSLAAAVNSSDLWTGYTARDPIPTLTVKNWALFKHPAGVNQIIFGNYDTAYECSCNVSNKLGFDLTTGTDVAIPTVPGAVNDKVEIARHTGGAYSKIVFANNTTTHYKVYLIIDSPNSFVCIIRNIGTGAIVTTFGSLMLSGTTDVDYPFVNVASYSSESSSTDQSYSIGSPITAGVCQVNLLSSPATKLTAAFIPYQNEANSILPDSTWDSSYRLPYNVFSGQLIEEEILVASLTPEFLLRGKVPLIRYVQIQVPDGTISTDGTRAVIGSLSYPWDITTATMW